MLSELVKYQIELKPVQRQLVAAYLIGLNVGTPAYVSRGVAIPGDLVVGGRLLDDRGLHLVDVDLALGNLIALARQQATAYGNSAK